MVYPSWVLERDMQRQFSGFGRGCLQLYLTQRLHEQVAEMILLGLRRKALHKVHQPWEAMCWEASQRNHIFHEVI